GERLGDRRFGVHSAPGLCVSGAQVRARRGLSESCPPGVSNSRGTPTRLSGGRANRLSRLLRDRIGLFSVWDLSLRSRSGASPRPVPSSPPALLSSAPHSFCGHRRSCAAV